MDADTESFAVVDDDHTISVLQVAPSKIFENGGTATLREGGRDGCPSTRFLLSSVGRLVPLGGLEAVAVPVGRQHGGMVHDTVDDGRGGGRIQEHLGGGAGRTSVSQSWKGPVTFFACTFAPGAQAGAQSANSLGKWRARQDSNLRPSA